MARSKAPVADLRWDTIRIALGFLTLITVSRIQEEIPLIAIFRPGPLLTALCLGLALTQPKSVSWKKIAESSPVRRIYWLFALMFVSIPFGLSFGASASYMLNRFISTGIYFALIVIAIRDTVDLKFVISSYVASMLILIYSGFFLWEKTNFNGFERVGSAGMYDANDLAPIFGFGLPMALLLAQTSNKWLRWLGFGTAALTPGLIALTGSRGGFLSLIATCLGLLIMAPGLGVMKRFGIIFVAVIGMALVAPAGYIQKMGTIFDTKNDYNFTDGTGRVAIWKRGIGFIKEHPITGLGMGNFGRAQWEHPTFTETGAQLPPMAPHNTFIEVAAELGIPAVLVFISVIFTGIFSVLALRSRLPKRWLHESAERRFLYLACSYLPVSFIGWAAGAFFVSHAYLAPFYLMVAILGSVLVLIQRERRADRLAAHALRTAGT